MYVPRWVIHIALGLAALCFGWFAQNAAAAQSADAPSLIDPTAALGADTTEAATAAVARPVDPATITEPGGSAPTRPTSSTPSRAYTEALAVGGLQLPRLSSAAAAQSEPHLEYSDDQLVSPIVDFGEGRTVDIAGYEDHSINVAGRRQFVVYDDSNLFVNRDGKINANTGDTDSAGLNAVDTVGSYVSAGPHCDDGCDDESIISAEHGHFDEADGGNDDEDSDDEEAEDDDEVGELAAATALATTRRSASRVASASTVASRFAPTDPPETCEEADTCSSGGEPDPIVPGGLSIGGDGWDDLAVRLSGEDNIIVTDDSNVVLGGTGDVNAQIGDSDTGGTVTMGTLNSVVRGGVSR